MLKGRSDRAAQKFFSAEIDRWIGSGRPHEYYCVLEENGQVVQEQRVSTTARALGEAFAQMPRSRIALETGLHSPWVSRQLSELGHEVIGAHARKLRLIG